MGFRQIISLLEAIAEAHALAAARSKRIQRLHQLERLVLGIPFRVHEGHDAPHALWILHNHPSQASGRHNTQRCQHQQWRARHKHHKPAGGANQNGCPEVHFEHD